MTATTTSSPSRKGGKLSFYSAIKNDYGLNVKKGKVEQYHFFI
jgi:hypothetical protein